MGSTPPTGQHHGLVHTIQRPGRSTPAAWPRVDDHLVTPGTREELIRGRRVLRLPTDRLRSKQRFRLNYVLGPHIADDYEGATALLTRVGPESNFATDTCIVRNGIDPSTGARWLEEFVFEVVTEESIRDITERAEDLSARGVRRVVAIFAEKGEVHEWSPAKGQWLMLDLDAEIADRTLRRPLRIRALLDDVEADNAVVDALVAKGNRQIAALLAASHRRGRAEGLAKGRAEGGAEVLRRLIGLVCTRLEIPLPDRHRNRLADLDVTALEQLFDHLLTERRWP